MNPALLVLAAWTCAALVCLGLGTTVAALLRVRERKVGVLFWLGFASTLAILQLWHFFLPVGDGALVAIGALAAVGILLARPSIASLREAARRAGWHPILVTAAAVWLASRSALGSNRGTIEIIHLLGGTDGQIAQIFQRSIGFDAVLGGTVGLGFGLAAILLLGRQFAALGSGMVAGGGLGMFDWAAIASIPLAGVVIAMFNARLTVLAALRKML